MDHRIARIDVIDADMAMVEPFGIATGAQTVARSSFLRLELACGAVGWGEAAPFPAVNGETREHARADLAKVAWVGRDARRWRALSNELAGMCGSARCALETALIDALCVAASTPMTAWFGGVGTSVVTDVTITTGTVEAAATAAARLAGEGIATLKVKVGGVDDVARVAAIAAAAPGCSLLLDGNAALPDVDTARRLLEVGRVVLFEQPFAREDLASHAALRAYVRVAFDESVQSASDIPRLAHACDVVNLKATKSGLVGVLDAALAARACGVGLMIGAMVESRVGLSAAASLAAGLGGFEFVDLDTDRWLASAPVEGGFVSRGGVLDLGSIAEGHGARVVLAGVTRGELA